VTLPSPSSSAARSRHSSRWAGISKIRPAALIDGAQKIFDRLGFGDDFQLMRDKALLDLDNRRGKAPGGYQANLNECRLPFIFMNAVGQQRDVKTLQHEGGHAFHALATKEEELFAYRNKVPTEFSEVTSMSMELLGNERFQTRPLAGRASNAVLLANFSVSFWTAAEAVRIRLLV
jgi:oligoendopeptidase F